MFPDAVVVHSTRPPERRWASYATTIGKLVQVYRDMPLPPHVREMMDLMQPVISERTFGGKPTEKTAALAAFGNREDEVRAAIPKQRLPVFDFAEGWAPLCAFQKVPVPDTPFPHRNVKDDFWQALGGEPA